MPGATHHESDDEQAAEALQVEARKSDDEKTVPGTPRHELDDEEAATALQVEAPAAPETLPAAVPVKAMPQRPPEPAKAPAARRPQQIARIRGTAAAQLQQPQTPADDPNLRDHGHRQMDHLEDEDEDYVVSSPTDMESPTEKPSPTSSEQPADSQACLEQNEVPKCDMCIIFQYVELSGQVIFPREKPIKEGPSVKEGSCRTFESVCTKTDSPCTVSSATWLYANTPDWCSPTLTLIGKEQTKGFIVSY